MAITTLYGRSIEQRPIGQIDAVTVLSVFVVTLLILPARFVIVALGAAGTPAGIMAVLCLMWYLSAMFTPALMIISSLSPLYDWASYRIATSAPSRRPPDRG